MYLTQHATRQPPATDTLQITFIFILILFVDSVNRVYRVQVELAAAKNQGGAAA